MNCIECGEFPDRGDGFCCGKCATAWKVMCEIVDRYLPKKVKRKLRKREGKTQ